MGSNDVAEATVEPVWFGPSFAHDYDRLVTTLGRRPTFTELVESTGLSVYETAGMLWLLAEERGWL
jgi:hypothetical protein